MCGIVGFYGFEDRALLERAKRTLSHRGPDDEGSYTDRLVSLGHRRLAIIDLSKEGRQPMSNEDGSIWIVFNGEIYNFQALRSELESTGHRFSSNTDTEVIIHGYEQWGHHVVKRLRGMFAFALWDTKKKQLILARDRLGKKPLYYTWQGNKFIFASEIKAILATTFVRRGVNIPAFYDYLTFVTTIAPQTLFEGIFKLQPGHILLVKNGRQIVKKYWDVADFRLNPSITETEAVNRTAQLLTDSVKIRMISDVPQGVFLSGGIDSSTITALMSRLSDQPVNTFSIATGKGEKYNELPYARIVADRFGTSHTEIYLELKDLINFLPELIYYEDEPIGDPVNIPTYYLASRARAKGVKVLHVGEGADELFCGYRPYGLELLAHKLIKILSKMPKTCQKAAIELARMYTTFSGKNAHRLLEDQVSRVRCGEDFPWHTLLGFTETEKRVKLFSDNFQRQIGAQNSYDVLRRICRSVSRSNSSDIFLQKERVIELKHRIPELLLMKVDKFTMAASVEARAPFLDHHLVEFEMGVLPRSIHMKSGYKHVLKRVMAARLPEQIIRRRKMGFGMPLVEHFTKELKELALHEFENPELKKFINTKYATDLLRLHRTKRYGDTSFRTWLLLNFALWYRHWIGQERIRF